MKEKENNSKSDMSNSLFTNLSKQQKQILKNTDPMRFFTLNKNNAQKLRINTDKLKNIANIKRIQELNNEANERLKGFQNKINKNNKNNSIKVPTLRVSNKYLEIKQQKEERERREQENKREELLQQVEQEEKEWHKPHYSRDIAARLEPTGYRSLEKKQHCVHCGNKEKDKKPVVPNPNDPKLPTKPKDVKKKKPSIFEPYDKSRLELYIKKSGTLEKRVEELEKQIKKILLELKKNYVRKDYLTEYYYDKQYINKNFVTKEYLKENYYDVTEIDDRIALLDERITKLESMELQLQQQGGQNEDLIKTYVNELSKMLLLAKKNLKIYHLNKFLTRPEKIFAFLYNSLRGLQLEQKIKVLQQDKNNFDFNNINNLDIKPETIADRIQKDCNDIGLNVVQNNTLQQMTKICLAIIDNDKKGKNNKKDVTTMINDNTNDLKTIGKNLLQSNKLPAYQQQDQEIINEVLNYHNKFEQYYK